MRPRLAAAAALGALLAACGTGGTDPAAPPLRFTVGTLDFSPVSGGVVRSGGQLEIYLSDQIDTCLAVAHTPVGTATYLRLVVAPPTSGPQVAAVVPPKPVPAPGEAVGALEQFTGVVAGTAYPASEGTLGWSGGASGDVILETIDVGFAGAAGRITASGLRLTACN